MSADPARNVMDMTEYLRTSVVRITKLDADVHGLLEDYSRQLLVHEIADDPDVADDVSNLHAGKLDLSDAISSKDLVAQVRASVLGTP